MSFCLYQVLSFYEIKLFTRGGVCGGGGGGGGHFRTMTSRSLLPSALVNGLIS